MFVLLVERMISLEEILYQNTFLLTSHIFVTSCFSFLKYIKDFDILVAVFALNSL